MTFTSLLFALFAGITILIYYLFPLKKYQWTVLLVASYFFYVYNSYKYTVFILFTTLTIYFAAAGIEKISADTKQKVRSMKGVWNAQEKKAFKSGAEKRKRGIMAAALLANFGILFVIKYLNFLAGGLMHLFGHAAGDAQIVSLLLPLGISFYTFQATGYLIDVFRGTVKAEKNLFRFALFVSFFPQIIQGPISAFDQLGEQLFAEHRPEWHRFKSGGELILWGLFKKLVIADRLFAAINMVAGDYRSYPGEMILFASLMYALQLYADFSGGIDIARGVARMLGIDLENNFRQPYFSRSINEYWRRWHITLGAWMKKYVFYSLAVSNLFLNISKRLAGTAFGRTSAGKHISRTLPTAFASLIVFMLIGIWHGANSRYIGFGLWNGLVIMFSTLMAPAYEKAIKALHIKAESAAWKLFQMVRTFVVVLIGYYFDIAPDIKGAFDMMWRSVADLHTDLSLSQIHELDLALSDLAVVAYGAAVILYFSIRLERSGLEAPGDLLDRRPAWLQWIVLLAGAVSVIMLGIYGSGSEGVNFVYMGF